MEITPNHQALIKHMAQEANLSPEQMLSEILDEYFADVAQDIAIAKEILAQAHDSIPLEEVLKDSGLDRPH